MPASSFLTLRPGPVARLTADLSLAAGAGVLCWYAAAETPADRLAEPGWLAVVAAAVISAPLAVRRRWPVSVAVAVAVASTALLGTGIIPDYASPAPLLVVGAALYNVGRHVAGPRGRWTALGASALLLCGVVFGSWWATHAPQGPGLAGMAFTTLVCGASWAVGWTLRERRRHSELTAAQATARAVAEERLRIAREMHDAVGHSLSLIAVKAGVANHVARQRPEEALAALEVIESASRSALAELRRTVGALRTEPVYDVAPTLRDLTGLADRAQAAGVAVDLDVHGSRDLPELVALAAYRIVQESLTNVVRHAAPATCRVDVLGAVDHLRIEVTDDGRRQPAPAAGGTGLAGMRERVAAHGGTFSAGPRPEGGYAVVATLPYGSPS
ncbi:sensor histidine kinase [Actinoplanes flavus]|uniref:histidine kinase n=1 Tax=Actinoplanes flavus TaxID=2820290 RepID=A0ABS3UIJ4_9ACTN|nr:sensor histidine kinase [Actinoplanes flavus]MBO3738031.1 sensor histidine kinase [Actinoplanes flavus]